jgi:hypothetical protein
MPIFGSINPLPLSIFSFTFSHQSARHSQAPPLYQVQRECIIYRRQFKNLSILKSIIKACKPNMCTRSCVILFLGFQFFGGEGGEHFCIFCIYSKSWHILLVLHVVLLTVILKTLAKVRRATLR